LTRQQVIGDLLTAVGRLERVHDFTDRLRFNTAQAAEYANCHPDTILRSLQAGELHGGGQRKAGGRWSIRRECLDAWLDGEHCPHQSVGA
jgi:excisionase family DNA binding protein